MLNFLKLILFYIKKAPNKLLFPFDENLHLLPQSLKTPKIKLYICFLKEFSGNKFLTVFRNIKPNNYKIA